MPRAHVFVLMMRLSVRQEAERAAANGGSMTVRQARFVEALLTAPTATAAALQAGYSPNGVDRQAARLVGNRRVQAALAKRREEMAFRARQTADAWLKDVLRRGTKAEDAEQFGAALKASELAGKHLGHLAEKVEHSGPDGGPIQMQALIAEVPTERLVAALEALKARVALAEAGAPAALPEPGRESGPPAVIS